MFVRQQYRREYGKGLPHKKPIASETDACKMKSFARLGGLKYGKGLPHKKPIASETDACKMKSFARLGGLKEAPASIGGEYFTMSSKNGATERSLQKICHKN